MKTLDYFYLIITLLIFLGTIYTIFNIPKDYGCYKTECTEYNTDECIHLGIESTGFLSSEDYYSCDGIKVAKKCSLYEEVNQNIEPNVLDVLSFKCNSLEEKA